MTSGGFDDFPIFMDFVGDFELYCPMNEGEGTDVLNRHPTNPDGTTVNTPAWVDSFNAAASKALDFEESSSQYATFGDHDAFSFTDGSDNDQNFTISCWINTENTAAQHLIAKDDVGVLREWFLYIYPNTDKFRVFLFDHSTGGYMYKQVEGVDTIDTWYFLTVTYNGNETLEGISMYVDGELASITGEAVSGTYNGMENGDTELYVGGSQGSATYFDGILDEPIIWNKTLSEAEVSDLYYNYTSASTETKTIVGFEDVAETLDLDSYGLGFSVVCNTTDNDDPCYIQYEFKDVDEVFREYEIFEVERDIWLVFKFKIDLLRSKAEWEFEYYNGTDIEASELKLQEFSPYHPAIFSAEVINVFYGNNFIENGVISWKFDYFKCPFEEFQWKAAVDLPTPESEWSTDYGFFTNKGELGCTAEVSNSVIYDGDFLQYRYTVPSFDSLSGVLFVNTNETAAANQDETVGHVGIYICSTFRENGTISNWIAVHLRYISWVGGDSFVNIYDKDYTTHYEGVFDSTFHAAMELPITAYITPNNELMVQINHMGEVTTTYMNITDSSSEFLIFTDYWTEGRSIAGDQHVKYRMGVRDWELITRDLFGIVPDLADMGATAIGAVVKPIAGIFIQCFKLLGSIIAGLGAVLQAPLELIKLAVDAVKLAVNALGTVLSTAVGVMETAISGAITTMQSAITGAITAMENVLAAIEAAVLAAIDAMVDAIDAMEEAITNAITAIETAIATLATTIWTAIIAQIYNIFDEIMDALGLLLDSIVSLVGGFFALLWEVLIEAPLAGITTWFNYSIWAFLTLLGYAVLAFDTIVLFLPIAILALTAWIFLLSGFENEGKPAAWIGDCLKRFFINLSDGFTFWGFKFPLPLGAIWFAGAVFYGWTPF